MTTKPIPDETRAQVLNLHAEGLARNEIARRLNISAGSVTKIVHNAGGAFDRSETKDATRARAIDLAAERTRLAERMNQAAHDMLDMLDKPFTVFNFGGKDNTFASAELDSPPVEARRTIITSAAIVFDKVTRIVEKSDTGLEQAVGVLDTIAEGFAAAAERYRAETVDDEG